MAHRVPRPKRTPSRPVAPAARHPPRREPPRTRAELGIAPEYDTLDPDLRAYLRAPYDPLNGARAARFFTRGLLQQPPAYGWMRPFALLIALLAIATLVGGVGAALASGGGSGSVVALAQVLLVAGPVGLVGAVVLWRLVRNWGRRPRA